MELSTPAKKRLKPDDSVPNSRGKAVLSPHTPAKGRERRRDGSQPLVMMILDVTEEAHGRFNIWGKTLDDEIVLLHVNDFLPYFYIAAPTDQESIAEDGEQQEWSEQRCAHFCRALNRELPADLRVVQVKTGKKRPIMYYRPSRPDGSTFLQLMFQRATNITRAAKTVEGLMRKDVLRQQGFTFQDMQLYEHEVKLLQRFQVDACVCGGGWIHVPPVPPASRAVPPSPATPSTSSGANLRSPEEADAPLGYRPVRPADTISQAHMEVVAPWRAVQCLTPDATQLADGTWSPEPYRDEAAGEVSRLWEQARHVASEGHIQPLRLMTLDVLRAPRDAKPRAPVPGEDPIVAVICGTHTSEEIGQGALSSSGAGLGGGGEDDEDEEEVLELEHDDEELGVGGLTPGALSGDQVVFMWRGGSQRRSVRERVSGAWVEVYSKEEDMLQAWLAHVLHVDPDAFVVFQVKDNLGALAARFAALRLGGGGLHLSRLARHVSKPLAVRSVVWYRPSWVKEQRRMASTSNQETFRTDIDGRLVFDLLRQVLSSVHLASFSLQECVHVLLGRRLELLPPSALAHLAGLPASPGEAWEGPEGAGQKALRLARYLAVRAEAVRQLIKRLATIPESIELARATGLTIPQSLYNAQMIRTWSLLLRNAQRQGYVVSGRQDSVTLVESPFLMHPVELGTVGLYRQPVAVLDFASLYPSLFRAYNLDYSTLLHPADVDLLPADQIITTPSGSKFVVPEVRRGILPTILAALMTARAATRAALKQSTDPTRRAILDSRQKAIKLIANASYGFTGAQASNLQCAPLADSCLALGNMSTRRAKELISEAAIRGDLGEEGRDARIIYAQTDSVFVLFPSASTGTAIRLGKLAAKLASEAYPAPMALQFEKVACPFLLLHVNRYAGRAFEEEGGSGALMVKGLKSMWRQAAPIVRSTLQGALQRIIMQDNVKAAVTYVESQIRRLLSGRVEMSELIMTGGLWRITGQQVAQAAAEDEGAGAAPAGRPPTEDVEVRGPHASLAVRLQKRDPGRTFLLGERLGYVLLPGCRTQDEAAEEPLTAAKQGLLPDLELYWKNKLLRPLSEIFKTCLSPAEMQALVSGPHTMVRVDALATPAPVPPSAVGTSTPSSKSRGRPSARRQTGLSAFYKTSLKCLNCRRSLPAAASGGGKEAGLCADCAAEEGVPVATYLSLLQDLSSLEVRNCYAHALCARCHSGGMMGPVLCENAECAVLYARLRTASRLAAADHSLQRIEW